MRILVFVAALLIASPAFAGPHCTDEPQSKWLSKDEMVEKITAANYEISVFKITAGKCYEIYGRNGEGRRVEIYFHPMTGEVVRTRTR